MTATTARIQLPGLIQGHAAGTGYVLSAQVGALETLITGAFCSIDSGDKFIGNLTVPDPLYGICLETVTGTSANGGIQCDVLCEAVIEMLVASVAQSDVGAACFAQDNQTVSMTNDGTDTPIGTVLAVPVAGTAIIKMFPPRLEVPVFTVTAFTEDLSLVCDGAAPQAGDSLGTLVKHLQIAGMVQGTTAA